MFLRLKERLGSGLFRSLRLVFRLTPMPERTRDRLRQGFLDHFQGIVPQGPRGQMDVAWTSRHRARTRSDLPALGHVGHRHEPLPSPLPATLIAFYLPQFHTIPENDAWWGNGFTEWRNVTRALPQFAGHAQPRLPADLGYYDLRNPDILRQQAALAREYGIDAFCFYFYWFGGKTLLEAPLQQWLSDASIDMPFCLCWANENWSRRWDGRAEDILIGQQHGAEDDLAFIAHVARYMRDPRYLRIDGKPLLLVYRPGLLPEARATAARWRAWCASNGIGEICIAYTQSFDRAEPKEFGFDAAVEFPPNLATPVNITAQQRLLNPEYRGQVLDWRELASDYAARPMPSYRLFPGVNCGWDNEARRTGQGRTYLHASPRRYRDWLHETIASRLRATPAQEKLVFINAWNEWAEGAMLEPDTRLGHAWLQATRDALRLASDSDSDKTKTLSPAARPCVVVHAWYPEVFKEILASLLGRPLRLIVTTTADSAPRIEAILAEAGVVAETLIVENRGRDILPFVRVANRLLDEGVDLVLKLHTKRSPHRDNGGLWLRDLLDRLASPSRMQGVIQAFAEDRQLGIVAPEGHLLPLHEYAGANRPGLDYLKSRLGLALPPDQHESFISGSMFWARLSAMRPLLDAHLEEWEFEPEHGQVDGTLAHAIERVFALCAQGAGYQVRTAASVCGEQEPDPSHPYPFAQRG